MFWKIVNQIKKDLDIAEAEQHDIRLAVDALRREIERLTNDG